MPAEAGYPVTCLFPIPALWLAALARNDELTRDSREFKTSVPGR